MKMINKKFIVASIIPTGIRCSIGGYIGDAILVTNKLASVCDYLITNPNSVNGGAFNFQEKNVLYVEGYAIDQFFQNKIGLSLPKKNSIGIIVERIEDATAIRYVLKTIQAFKTILGINIKTVRFIRPLRKSVKLQNGQFCGEIENVNPLIEAAEDIRRNKGVDALAICTHIKIEPKYILQYQNGKLPNPYGLLEALISHSITAVLKIPSAHAPMLTKKEMELYLFNSFNSDPRSALENISSAYLGSVLKGLDSAPRFAPPRAGQFNIRDVDALIIPSNCLRSIPVAMTLKYKIPIIEVRENKNIFNHPLLSHKDNRVKTVRTYDDALHLLLKIKAGYGKRSERS